ncbi:hypothetical protein C2W62_40765, partial [Candidatus Entotheonella serta]
HWSCTSLRKVLGSLRAGMAPHREGAQIDQLLSWLEQARASKGPLLKQAELPHVRIHDLRD